MFQEKALTRAMGGTGSLVDFSGIWENQLHSKVVLIQKNDVLTGTYESAVSGDRTKTVGDLQGYVDGALVSFRSSLARFSGDNCLGRPARHQNGQNKYALVDDTAGRSGRRMGINQCRSRLFYSAFLDVEDSDATFPVSHKT
jgi:hypothetical protein